LIGVPKGIRVLVAHGNVGSLHVLREMLSSWRMETVAADGVGQAVHGFRQAAADLRPFALGDSGCEDFRRQRTGTGSKPAWADRLPGPHCPGLPRPKRKKPNNIASWGSRVSQEPVTQPELMDAITGSLASESLERLNAFSGGARAIVAPDRARRILVAKTIRQ